MNNINDLIPKLTVDYDDLTILEKESPFKDLVDQYFDSVTCHNKDIEKLLYEVIGYSLSKTAKLGKAFIFKGSGRNGKSVIFRIISAILGPDYCSYEHLENISGGKAGAKSSVKYLKDCTVNIAEDQKPIKYINTSLITRLISGEPIVISHYYNKATESDEFITMDPYATLLFSVNETVNLKETGIYMQDRFVVIPFNNIFTDDGSRDIDIKDNLCSPESLQIITTRAIEAFKNVLNNGKFSIPDVVVQETKKYFMECNNAIEFSEQYPIKSFISKADYYNEYCKWCDNNNVEKLGNNQFGMKIIELGYRSERFSFGSNRSTYYVSPNFRNEESRTLYEKYLKKYQMTDEQEKVYDEDEKEKLFGITFNKYLSDMLYEIAEDDEGTSKKSL